MLNAVIDYLPGPLDVPAYKGLHPVTKLRQETLSVVLMMQSRCQGLLLK